MAHRDTKVTTSGEVAVYSLDVTPPTVQDDDVLVMCVLSDATNNPGVNFPAGWTVIASDLSADEYDYRYIAIKIADGESGNYTLEYNGVAIRLWVTCSSYSGRDVQDPVDVYSNTKYTTANTTIRAASMTISQDACDIVWFGQLYKSGGSTITEPNGFTSRGSAGSGSFRILAADYCNASSGATGAKDGTAADSVTDKHAIMVALAPASGISIPLLNHLLLGD
jgi:hypothetical protein